MTSKDQERFENMLRAMESIPELNSRQQRPPHIPRLNRRIFRKSTNPLGDKQQAKYEKHAAEVKKRVFIPLLRKCAENARVAEQHIGDPVWRDAISGCRWNLETMERKVSSAEIQWE